MRRRSLLLGFIVPLALLAGQLSTVVHSMVVEHQRCPEHGELVHRQAGPAEARADTAGYASLGAIAATERHGDDHCLSLVARREISGLAPQASVGVAPPPHHAVAAATIGLSSARDALLSLAPKTSPPLSA